MRKTIILAVALVASVTAFGQNNDVNWFAMSDDLEVAVALTIEDGEKFLNFQMYDSDDVLTSQDTVYFSLYNMEDEVDVVYPNGIDLNREYIKIHLTDAEVDILKSKGLEYMSINKDFYFFEEDKLIISKAAKNIF